MNLLASKSRQNIFLHIVKIALYSFNFLRPDLDRYFFPKNEERGREGKSQSEAEFFLRPAPAVCPVGLWQQSGPGGREEAAGKVLTKMIQRVATFCSALSLVSTID
jgi:hypothetical protein